jgi:hypothetical protein
MHFETLVKFHFDANTPLMRLANSVRWFEEMARRADSKPEKSAYNGKAKTMRRVISVIFAARDYRGQYIAS